MRTTNPLLIRGLTTPTYSPAVLKHTLYKKLCARVGFKSDFLALCKPPKLWLHSIDVQQTRGQLGAEWQSQMQPEQASVVIESLPEQNLVCVIIVHRTRNEAKIHSTWCIHCFEPNTAGPTAATATVQQFSPKTTQSLLQHLGAPVQLCAVLYPTYICIVIKYLGYIIGGYNKYNTVRWAAFGFQM